jgi:Flp pilus assembly protein TadD
LTKDAAQKIEALQSENNSLSQKLSSAETSITKLTAESLRRKQELDGMQRELTTLKDQLATSRDQNDRNATTITELRSQLDDGARRLAELKAKGMSSDDFSKMNKENEMLRDIVMRQLKDQARRAAVKQMLTEELTRLDVQSSALNAQLEELGRPSVQLTDDERALFKDPLVTVADSASPSAMAATITTVRSRQPGSSSLDDVNNPPGTEALTKGSSQGGQTLAANKAGPQVQTVSQPRVNEDLMPLAREAKEDFDRQNYAEAERTYDKLLARDPKNPYLLSNQGVVLFRQDKLKSAEVMLKKAVTVAPSDAFGQSTLGIIYYRMHRYDEAMRYLTTALQLDPKNATAHNYLGITASQKGYPEAAADEIQKAIALNPNYADAHFNLAVVYATNQPPDKSRAREHYDAAVRLGASPDPTLEKLIGS